VNGTAEESLVRVRVATSLLRVCAEVAMKMTLELARVQECDVTSCAYNVEQSCRARAITVGGGPHPACDTFFASDQHARDTSRVAGVGACKVTNCRYNSDLECAAEAIRVGVHDRHADCVTFAPR
jgi:hypothetical protein